MWRMTYVHSFDVREDLKKLDMLLRIYIYIYIISHFPTYILDYMKSPHAFSPFFLIDFSQASHLFIFACII